MTGVVDVKFDKERIQRVVITYDPDVTSIAAIKAAIEKNGDKVLEPTE
ncbi:MAG: hypothetical protein HYX91_06090 [Chloroflexi bacterium]|nr:hypothetical protein [Chloroflexota bacterium]